MDVYSNNVLSGGTARCAGIGERITKELTALAPAMIAVIAQPVRKYSARIGGSILSSPSTRLRAQASKGERVEPSPASVRGKRCRGLSVETRQVSYLKGIA
jgi:actin